MQCSVFHGLLENGREEANFDHGRLPATKLLAQNGVVFTGTNKAELFIPLLDQVACYRFAYFTMIHANIYVRRQGE